MTNFREKGKVTTFVNCVKPTEAAIKFTRKTRMRKKKDYLHLFILILCQTVKSQFCMVSPFFNTGVFWSFLPLRLYTYFYLLNAFALVIKTGRVSRIV